MIEDDYNRLKSWKFYKLNLLQVFGGFQRLRQSPGQLQFNCSVQLMLVLMLTIFLIGKLLTVEF